MAPSATTRASATRYSTEQWEQQKDLITRLYSKENKRLVDVCEILTVQHGFHATTRSLKHRIRVWHLDKKQKDHEMRAILKMYLSRKSQGKQSIFRLRGRLIDHGEISRYFRRKGIYSLESLASELANVTTTLPDIICQTPEPDEHGSPESLAGSYRSGSTTSPLESATTFEDDFNPDVFLQTQPVKMEEEPLIPLEPESPPEAALVRSLPASLSPPTDLQEMEYVLAFTKSFLGSGLTPFREQGLHSADIDPVHWRNDFLQASYLLRVQGNDLAFAEFSSVYDRIPALLESQDPAFFAVILGLLCFPKSPLDFALSEQIFRYIWSMAQVVLGRTHPITLLLSCALTSDRRAPLAILTLQAASGVAEEKLGPHHQDALEFLEQLAHAHADLEEHSKVIMYREKILKAHQATDGDASPYTCWAMIDLANAYIHANQDDAALAMIEKAFQRAEKLAPAPRTELFIRGLGRMAFINDRQGRAAMSRMLLRSAVEIGNEFLGSQEVRKVCSKEELEKIEKRWRPFFQSIKDSVAAADSKANAFGNVSNVLQRPDLTGLASHLRSMVQGRNMTLQKERHGKKDENSRICRNMLNLFMIQSMSITNA
jgi:tetratricopeptide (TPR) repeat protein